MDFKVVSLPFFSLQILHQYILQYKNTHIADLPISFNDSPKHKMKFTRQVINRYLFFCLFICVFILFLLISFISILQQVLYRSCVFHSPFQVKIHLLCCKRNHRTPSHNWALQSEIDFCATKMHFSQKYNTSICFPDDETFRFISMMFWNPLGS